MVDAIEELSRAGVSGPCIYLLDIVPLCEMAQADGEVHPAERSMILGFLDGHLERLRKDAGVSVVGRAQGLHFVDWVLNLPPEQVRHLRQLYFELKHHSPEYRQQIRQVLDAAEAVGAIAPSPREPRHMWDSREIDCMWDLQDALLIH
jgi:hypothetical protein